MRSYVISSSSRAEDMEPVGMALHELLNRLPVTARSKERPGIRIEDGKVVDRNYTGPVLEEVLHRNVLIKQTPVTGEYRGVPVVVSPIREEGGEAIGAIGVVDITGIFDLATLMEHQSAILKQVCGKDPCPLPTEQIGAKR
ncbi:hypothetical protein J2741_001848 [Methanolinea mesophila]|uniref:DUF2111 domain-containing protein n=1 Tax=Methanolinea mesophila TaxID=547055 RepID=UPI001AE63BDC|nr:DUF2111 domain-containing protein [Methanolinea mesophila]MBP1929301.1 hypothetical protein [Methanolinea mesophila]